jgi:hypothetical protein
VFSAIQGGVRILVDEMGRTLKFLKADANIAAERLILLGGGSSIRHIHLQLAELTGIATEKWTFPGHAETAFQDAVFAAAFAAAIGGAP